MRWIRIRQPVLLLSALWLALELDHAGFLRIGLLAALLHESGHVIVWMLLTRTLPTLRLSCTGIGLDTTGTALMPGQLFLLAAAGPAANLILCALTAALMNVRASYWGWFFASANCALGLFNLLPFGFLDGKQMLAAVRSFDLHLKRK